MTLPEESVFQNYAMILIDVLGQGEKLLQMSKIPTTPDEREKVMAVLRSTVGFVITLRESFRNYFTIAGASTIPIEGLEPERKGLLAANRTLNPILHGFSDLLTISIPLKSSGENCSALNTLYAALFGTSGMVLSTLSVGQALRGGIDIAPGMEIGQDEVYGPVLEKVYVLESKQAQYPRVVISPEVDRFLQAHEGRAGTDVVSRLARRIARDAREMITTDYDGSRILDYLSAHVRSRMSDDASVKMILDAKQCAASELLRFTELRDGKHAERWSHVVDYFDSKGI